MSQRPRGLLRTHGLVTPVLQWRRLVEIVTLLWASGFGWLVSAMGLRACVSLRCRMVCSTGLRSCPHHVAMADPLPERAVALLERLGPTYVKVGQLLATRTDYLPARYAAALRTLQDAVPAFPAAVARAIVAAELGRPVQEIFCEFDDRTLAAASLSQVHAARLPDGTEVAVKVQRPQVARQIEADLALLAWMARRLQRRRGDSLPFRPTDAVAEIAGFTRRELDFRNEARTAEAVGRIFTAADDVVIPRVHWSMTTARVLTTDRVHGQRPAPRAALTARGLDPDRLLEVGAEAMLRQVFELGTFHADPHPGNLLLLEGNRVCFLDFGLSGRLDRRQRRRMAMLLYALIRADYEAVADQLLHVSARLPGADTAGFQAALAELVEAWYAQGPEQFSVAELLVREMGLGGRYGVVFPRDLILLARALVHLEATAKVVDPRLRFADLVRPLLPQLRSTLLPGPGQLADLWSASWMDWAALAMDLPGAVPHLLDRLSAAGRPGAPVPEAVAAADRRSVLPGVAGGIAAGALAGWAGTAALRRRRSSGRAPSR